MPMVGIPQTSMGVGQFGVRPPNSYSPRGNMVTDPVQAGVDTPWYASGATWVIVFLVVGYLLTRQTLRG